MCVNMHMNIGNMCICDCFRKSCAEMNKASDNTLKTVKVPIDELFEVSNKE